ncbi:MAG: GNAT family N-acetyltransferase [Clostridia bacterium]|nr:GNAT family N-acetyltransferase [Clostridia bacterium]
MKYSIRKFHPRDAADLARAANHREIADYVRDSFPHPYLFSDAAAFIEEAQNGSAIIRAICSDDVAIGVISLFPGSDLHSRTAELGYFIDPAYRGRGFASRAVRDLVREGFESEGLHRIYAQPLAHNHASRRVLEKAGFVCETIQKNGAYKNGRVVDTCLYALYPE